MPEESTLYCPLDAMGYIEVRGADAGPFLHAQLGRDVMALGRDTAPLAAWHDARGRVRALLRIVRLPERYLLLLPAALAAPIAAKLGMFVLRADAAIAPTTAWFGAALLGTQPAALRARFAGLDARQGALARAGGALCISISARLHYVIAESAADLSTLCDGLELGTTAEVELAEIELGLPSVGPETAERYLPQMLNLDLLGAMSFDKGCYPGQEIIARTQNLGTVKRRLARFGVATGAAVPVGAEILAADSTSAGSVVRSAAAHGRCELLAVVQTGVLDGALRVDDGRALEPLDLPYR